jgi:hypothetical protein
MSTTKSVMYRGRTIGDLVLYAMEDWRNTDRPATARDLRLINATSAADLVHAILAREPKQRDPAEPETPWVVVVVREVCAVAAGQKDGQMEEQVLLLYVQRHGMDQILEIWGADIVRLKEEIGRMSGLDDG